jgi:hypothetical protein
MYKVQSNMYNTNSFILELVMGRLVNRVGQVFGRLRVIERAGTDQNKKVVWLCACECGKELSVPSGSLVTGNTTSCGCYLKERVTKHGGTGKGSYNTWRAMMRRCHNPKDKDYKSYGAMGITVAPEWHNYVTFAEDMGEPEGVQTLDRINGYAGYSKNNCRWASPSTQARNIRTPKANKAGVTGVIKTYYGKWMSSITANKKRYYGPVRETIADASADRKELERLHWGVV